MFVPLKKAFTDPGTRKIFRLVGPTIIGMAAYEVNVLVSSVIATTAGTGVVSSLQFSNRLLELLLGVFAVSIGTVVLTELSENAKRQEWEKFTDHLLFAVNVTALLTLPATLFSMLNSREIIALLFRGGAFTNDSVVLTATIFVFHISGLYCIAVNRVVAPAFYAQEDTTSPTIAGIISVGANLLFCLLLVKPMGGGGIALAATLSSLVNTGMLFFFLIRKRRAGFVRLLTQGALYGGKTLLITLLIAYPALLIKPHIYRVFYSFEGKVLGIGLPFILFAVVYFFAVFLLYLILKDTYAHHIMQSLKRRLPWKA